MATKKRKILKRAPLKKIHYKTLKVAPDAKPFVQFVITHQTFVWLLLSIAILILALLAVDVVLRTIEIVTEQS